ncbi:MAG: PHP domain-containing protein [Bacillota bacterium]|nr:PHP domain-containing protein [Bacillota bacterium]
MRIYHAPDDGIVVRGPAGSGPLRDSDGPLARGLVARGDVPPREALERLIASGPVDLHLHTSASDGLESPAQLMYRVLRSGLVGFAVSDHDTLSGVRDTAIILDKLNQLGIKTPDLVPAVEISTRDVEGGRHLLAYYTHGGEAEIESFLETQTLTRDVRNRRICERLAELGFPVDYEEVVLSAGHSIGRVHIAHALIRKGYVPDVQTAFERFLSSGRPAYVPRERVGIREAIATVLASGGLPVLAHPAHYGWCGRGGSFLRERLEALVEVGLEGVEVVHGDNTPEQAAELAAAAKELGLLRTVGSDWHSLNRQGRRMFTSEDDFRELLLD